MADTCEITPISAFLNTNLNKKIDSYGRLADRICRALGAPLITVEVHQDQLFENISIAAEYFTKYAGYTQEYLIFDSRLYERRKGIRLDTLFTLAGDIGEIQDRLQGRTVSPETSFYTSVPQTVYVANTGIPVDWLETIPSLSALFTVDIFRNQLIDKSTYTNILTAFAASPVLSSYPIETCFVESIQSPSTFAGITEDSPTQNYSNVFDYDLLDYRKVIDVTDFTEGSTTGINSLFTIEQTMAQQTYFSYAMGNYGFDLVSWYILKDWMDGRAKMLATNRNMKFDSRTQYMQMWPEPNPQNRFYGVISAYVERPLRDVIKEMWVYQYALALTKLSVAQVRGKYGQLTVFGGQMWNATDLFTQGTAECEKLMEQLMTGAAAGMGDASPPGMIIG